MTTSPSRTARKSRQKPPEKNREAPTTLAGRLRRHLPAVAIPNVVVVLGVILVALTGLLVTGTTLAALPATIAQLWLILHLVPVSGGGTVIGVLPMLPTIGLVALIAQRVRVAVRDRVSMLDLLILVSGALAVPLVLTLVACAMMWDAGRVFDVAAPHLGHAVLRTLLVHLIALVIGMGSRLWRALARRYGAPEWLVDAAVTAARILFWFAVASLVFLLVLLVAGASRQVEVATAYNSAVGVVGAVLLSLLYLPNALIAATAVLVGAEFHLGEASLSLYAIDLVELPPLPLLAVIPGWAHPWSVLLLAVTSLITAYVLGTVRFTVMQTLATAGFAALFILLAGFLTTGQLGYVGQTGPMLLLTAGLVFTWAAGIGVAAALLGRFADRRSAAKAEEAAVAEEPTAEAAAEATEDAAEDTAGESADGEPEVAEGEVVEESEEDAAADMEDTEDAEEAEEEVTEPEAEPEAEPESDAEADAEPATEPDPEPTPDPEESADSTEDPQDSEESDNKD